MKKNLLSFILIFTTLFSFYFIFHNKIGKEYICKLEILKQIHINFYDVFGENLIIDYNIKSAGVTKLRIFNLNHELLWKNQYVNDHIGNYQIILKYKNMKPGGYKFEIEHKNQTEFFFIDKSS